MTSNSYQERQEAKAERLTERAAKLAAEGTAQTEAASTFFRNLNGQPMLPGHHSYRADVNRRQKNRNKMDSGFQKLDEAKDLNRRAGAVGSGGVASDDPEAIAKLRRKLDYINSQRDEIKVVNAVCRKFAPKLRPGNNYDPEALKGALVEAGVCEADIRTALSVDFTGRIGIESYVLTNLSAKARGVTKRIDELEAMESNTNQEWTGEGWHMFVDVDAGRIFLEIEGGRLTTDSFRSIRSGGGFNWSRRDERFVRKITPQAINAMALFAPRLTELIEFA